MDHALACLRKIKHEIESNKFQEADMWCHFGSAIIRDPDEGKKQLNHDKWKLQRSRSAVSNHKIGKSLV